MQDKSYQKDPNIVARKIAGETILVPVARSVEDLDSIYTLNEVAARIWELLDGQMTVSQIVDVVTQEFSVTPGEAEQDIVELLGKLERIGAIQS